MWGRVEEIECAAGSEGGGGGGKKKKIKNTKKYRPYYLNNYKK